MRLAIFAALGVTLMGVGLAGSDRPKPRTHTVAMEDMRFQPEALTVAPGDTIIWVNKDVVPHSATSDAGSFDSKDIQAGHSWSYIAWNKGDFSYACTFHPSMKGMLHVE